MAIDSAEKRKAVAAISFAYYYPSVTPNASKDAEWRQQVGHSYSGIAADQPADESDLRHNDLTIRHNDETLHHMRSSLGHLSDTLDHNA